MIARVWSGATPVEKLEGYRRVLHATGVAHAAGTEGNRGVLVLSRAKGERAEFVFISLWDSMSAVERFAGPDPELAVYYPEDREFLLEAPPGVDHYEVEASFPAGVRS